MTDPRRRPDDRFAVPWSIDDEASDAIDVIDLTDAAHEIRHDVHCPACQGEDLDVAVTPNGERYDRCLACGRLWLVEGHRRRLLVAAQHRNPKQGEPLR